MGGHVPPPLLASKALYTASIPRWNAESLHVSTMCSQYKNAERNLARQWPPPPPPWRLADVAWTQAALSVAWTLGPRTGGRNNHPHLQHERHSTQQGTHTFRSNILWLISLPDLTNILFLSGSEAATNAITGWSRGGGGRAFVSKHGTEGLFIHRRGCIQWQRAIPNTQLHTTCSRVKKYQ